MSTFADSSERGSKRLRGTSAQSPAERQKCIDTIRVLSADMVEKANSGHPGAPMGCAPIAHLLYGSVMSFNPANPKWSNRDRFVLSNGHACALLYSMLHLTGYDLTIEDLKGFRQLHSKTPGHPENVLTPGVEVSTGPLGQGISNAVGLAMAEKHLAAVFNKPNFNVVDHFTYVICGDGCLQEGISSEACSLAGHLGLGKLIVCYDDNHITIDGDTNLSFTEDVNKRYESYGWHVETVGDVNDFEALDAALQRARSDSRPSLLKIRTVIGFGSSKQGSHGVHGAPLGASDLASVKTKFGFDPTQSFVVPADVAAYFASRRIEGANAEAAWTSLFQQYSAAHPALADEFTRRQNGTLPAGFEAKLPNYLHTEAKAAATRNRSEEVLNALAVTYPELIGGSADLTGSNLTSLKGEPDFQKDTPAGRYIRYGVREHAMAAISNGISAHGGLRPYCATFLNFIGYAMGAVRVSALSNFGVIYIMTHDSIGLGEDGPTHQPVEMLECLRATPNLLTFRPADGNETKGSYVEAVKHQHTPSVISLSRQAAPTLDGSAAEKVALGAYVLKEFGATTALPYPTLTLVSTGTEVLLTVQVAQELHSQETAAGRPFWVRVVSMPCQELFDQQPLSYRLSVLSAGSPTMSIEAAGITGWTKYAHAPFGINGVFGMSAPAGEIYKYFGFDKANLVAKAKEVVAFFSEGGSHPKAPALLQFPQICKAVGGH